MEGDGTQGAIAEGTEAEEQARMERVLLNSILGFRLFQLIEAGTNVRAAWRRLRHPWLSAAGVAAAGAELAWFTNHCRRQGSLREPAAVWVDVATTASLLGLSGVAAGEAERFGRAHWATAYGISSVAAAAAGLQQPAARAGATAVISGAYLSSVGAGASSGDAKARGATVYNTLMYPGFLVAVSAIAARMRRSASELRETREDAIGHVERLAVERERLRHQRLVHDSAVQTLQALSNLDSNDPEQLEQARNQAQREAARLRRVLSGTEEAEAPDLSDALSDLAEDFAGQGLRVELVLDGLAADPPFDVVAALHEATRHALLRARESQHARAVVRATSSGDRVKVTIRDLPDEALPPADAVEPSLLEATLTERLSIVGGSAVVRTTMARGTRVDLVAPLDARLTAR